MNTFNKDFDNAFYYENNDLGATYTKEETLFKLWAPLASKCFAKYIKNDDTFLVEMNKQDRGVFSVCIKDDLKNCSYQYIVINNGLQTTSNDPYGKETSLNSEYSCVVDFDEINKIEIAPLKNATANLSECIIYETNIRDFTEDSNTDIVNKGKYLGFIEEDRKTINGNLAGLDYLTSLGITHVQLQPILDFAGVDDLNKNQTYNWGYDVISFFALEGSYSLNPANPAERIKEFKQVVNKLHEKNIGVILDVVYNHIYKWEDSSLGKTVPNYYFRAKSNGELWNTSGCGNDIASERKQAQKLILDSLKYLASTFKIDGFRFDLMGILDLELMKSIEKELKLINPNILLYGEGWNIPDDIPVSNKAVIDNAFILDEYGFFNDMYRDLISGGTQKDKLSSQGFVNGCPHFYYGIDYALHGSCVNRSYNPRFKYASQSINYIECHDNATLFDKLSTSNNDLALDDIYKITNFANQLLLLSFGCPFIHMGQEIGLSKNNINDSYNVPIVNNMKWNEIDKRIDMVNNLQKTICERKYLMDLFKINDPSQISELFTLKHLDNDLMILESKNNINDLTKIIFVINPTFKNVTYELDDEYQKLEKDTLIKVEDKQALISGKSFNIFLKK